jgi:hypothetical protein
MTRKTVDTFPSGLADRMIARDRRLVNDTYTPLGHVRAELDRLARQVQKMAAKQGYRTTMYDVAIHDVLKLIREAKQ